jgi:hypothetical protein
VPEDADLLIEALRLARPGGEPAQSLSTLLYRSTTCVGRIRMPIEMASEARCSPKSLACWGGRPEPKNLSDTIGSGLI